MLASTLFAYSISILALGGANPSISDLLQGVADAQRTLDNFSVTSRFENVERPPIGSSNTVATRIVARYVVERGGRVRYEHTGEVPLGGQDATTGPTELRAIYDGNVTKSMEGNGDLWMNGRVVPRLAINWKMDPRDFLWAYNGIPIDQVLQERNPILTGASVFDGQPVWSVETAPNIAGDFEWKYQFLIDPSRSFAVPRKAQYCRAPTGGEWIEFSVIEGKDYFEVTPGIFVPQSVTNEFYAVEKDLSQELRWRMSITNENWTVNSELRDELFSFDFPSQLLVNNQVVGQTYRTAHITDQELREQVDQLDELRAELAKMPTQEEVLEKHSGPRPAWVYWSLLASGVCILLITLVIVLYRY